MAPPAPDARPGRTTHCIELSGDIATYDPPNWDVVKRGPVPYFFFSYARKDAVDPYLRTFYEDLCRELSVRAGVDLEEAGFFDVDQATGAMWPETTGRALSMCRVFVPVYSPSYFGSDGTRGQEWNAFYRRLHDHWQQTGQTLACIVPVWWLPPQAQPPAARFLHDTRDQFGPEYREYGLRYLMQLRENEDRYRDFLVQFAIKVGDTGRTPPRPLTDLDLLKEPNAFTQRSRPEAVTTTGVSGPKRVTFVVAAGTRAQMETVRAVLSVYGDTWDEWRPYHPECVDPIVLRAQGVAVAQRMISGPVLADDNLLRLLDGAQDRREVVILIVDPWVLGLDRYREMLQSLDSRRYGNVAILVPGRADEPLVLSNGLDARDMLRICLGNWIDGDQQGVRRDIDSVEKFEAVLRQVLIEIRTRIVNRAVVARRVEQGIRTSRPVLIGPEG